MTAPRTVSQALPLGLAPERSAALARLVSGATGLPDPGGIPWLAPALLFADEAVQSRLSLPRPDLGQALIQDYQAIRYHDRFPLGRPLAATVQQTGENVLAEYRFDLATPGGDPLARLDTALRLVPAADVGSARGALMRGAALRDAACGAAIALPQSQVADYLALSGDRNPIHSDPAAARAMGLQAPVVPGLLLASLVQPQCRIAVPAGVLQELKVRFLAPVCVGAAIRICTLHRGTDAATGRIRLRALLLAEDDRAAAIADLIFDAGPRP